MGKTSIYSDVLEKEKKIFSFSKTSLIFILGSIFLILLMILSLIKGVNYISFSMLKEVIFNFDNSNTNHLIIVDLRMPRIISSALVGAALAVAGAIMQGITRNPLADSGLMGLNSGAAFALSITFAFFNNSSFICIILYSFIGAGIAALLVNGIAFFGRDQMSPTRLVLSGVAVSLFLTALSQGIALYFEVAQNLSFWTSGGVSAATWQQLKILIPLILITLLLSTFLGKSISILNLGRDIARSLGLKVEFIYIICSLIILILAGSSVAIVGPVGFVGLIVPHVARYFVGVHYENVIPVSMIFGAILMVIADLGARIINPPFETPVGALIALIGAPSLLYITKKHGRK